MSKLANCSPLPTIEVGRANAEIHYTEEIIDWRRVAITSNGRKAVVSRQLTEEEILAGGVPEDVEVVERLGNVTES